METNQNPEGSIVKETASPQLTLLFDGGCSLCTREVVFLRKRDRLHRIAFVDINSVDYEPADYGGISYEAAMGRMHGLDANGEVVFDVAVFRKAYQLIGLGWLYAPSTWPIVSTLVNLAYRVWARLRLPLTGRPSLERICELRGGCSTR